MKDIIRLHKSPNSIHKWRATFPNGKKVVFGRKGYSDYTIHKDVERMHRYLTRHKKRENWGPGGKYTAGFWSRWFLWSKPSLQGAARATERALGNKFVVKY